MSFTKVDKFRVKTFRPGFCIYDLTRNKDYAEILAAKNNIKKLREMFPDLPSSVIKNPALLHENYMMINSNGEVHKELIVLEVPKYLPDGRPNVEGIIDVDTEDEAKMILNALRGTGDKRIGLDTAFGRSFSTEEGLLKPTKHTETDDLSKKKAPTK